MAAGQVRRAIHGVSDLDSTVKFYTTGLGLPSGKQGDDCVVVGSESSGMALELRKKSDGAYHPEGGYRGLNLRVADVAATLEAVSSCGGSVLETARTVEHGPSWEPEEPDEKENPVLEALVADPCGYPVLLIQDDMCKEPQLCGVRCDVHTWKDSQEW
jgi:predicted enzyme related to lactoylglutathione lyase